MNQKFFLAQDWDGHWMVVPVEYRNNFEQWVNAEDDTWPPPFGSKMVGGSPSLVEFSDPQIN